MSEVTGMLSGSSPRLSTANERIWISERHFPFSFLDVFRMRFACRLEASSGSASLFGQIIGTEVGIAFSLRLKSIRERA